MTPLKKLTVMPIFSKPKGEPLVNWKNVGNWISQKWNDFTGQTAINMQNKANMDLARYQSQMNENFYNKYSSPEAMMRQYREAGLNPNLVYGSASSGQSNVPSYSAPNISPNITGHQKFDKMLSTVSGLMGLVQGVYQTTAAREAAEQSAVRTLRDIVGLTKDEGDLRLQNTLFGQNIYDSYYVRRFGKASPYLGINFGGYLENYSKQWRDYQSNNFIKSGLSNLADFGVYAGNGNGSLQKSSIFGTPNLYIRNQSNAMKYQLMHDLGNKGVYGKLAVSLLNAIL